MSRIVYFSLADNKAVELIFQESLTPRVFVSQDGPIPETRPAVQNWRPAVQGPSTACVDIKTGSDAQPAVFRCNEMFKIFLISCRLVVYEKRPPRAGVHKLQMETFCRNLAHFPLE